MSNSPSQTTTATPFFSGLDTDFTDPSLFEKSVLIDDSYDDQTEILTILRDRVAREGLL